MDNAHRVEMSKTIASLRPIVLLDEQQEAGVCLWERTGHAGCGQKGEGLAAGVQVYNEDRSGSGIGYRHAV